MQGDIGEFARAVQLALAPAFLLSGIAALLNVMTGRIARIVDRGRALAEHDAALAPADNGSTRIEWHTLEQRRHLTSVAVTFTTIAALFVCVVIAGLFVEVMLQAPLKWFISAFFALAMLALVVGLTFFLREVHLAMHTVRIAAPEHRETDERGYAPTESGRNRGASLTTFASPPHILIAG
jgi:hypothetical protein